MVAVRREKIILEVEDNATAAFARAAAGAKLLDRALDDLDGSHVSASRSTKQFAADVDKTSTSLKRGESSLNQFTGRLATMARIGATIGPALVPLTAGMVPALAGLTAGAGAAAGALGVLLLASNGVGDGLKALNDFQLEPSAANAEKLAQAMDELGPAGERFVRYLDSIGPQMKDLQNAAREGLFPGVEDGIEALLTRLPQVKSIVTDIATAMGDLARGSGQGLASGRFDAFFDYLDKEAAPILKSFGEAAGNVFEAFANLLVGVDPLTQSFTQGLVSQTEALAEWSRNLANDEGFQSFIEYVQQSAPKALDFLGQFVQSMAAIAQAAAPVGDVVLPALTALLEVITAIAGSEVGTPIFATIAAMSALSSATKAWGAVSQTAVGQFVAGQTLAAGSASKTKASLTGLGKTAGVVGGIVAVTAAVDALASANDKMEAAVTSAQDALDRGDRRAARQSITDLEDQTDALEELANVAATSNNPWESFKANFDPGVFRNNLEDLFGDSQIEQNRAQVERLRNELEFLTASGGGTGNALLSFAGSAGIVADRFNAATLAGQGFNNMLDDISGALTRRGEWRAYQESIDAATASIKENGATHNENSAAGRANAAALDAVAANTSKWAAGIENVERKARFLQNARREFASLAEGMGYGERAAQRLADRLIPLGRARVIPEVNLDTSNADQREREIRARLRKLGLTRADPRLGADTTGYIKGDRDVLQKLRQMDGQTATPRINVNTSGAQAAISGVRAALNAINGDVATTYIRTVRTGVAAGNAVAGQSRADGGEIYGQRHPYGDKVLAYLAPGEEVISNRYGQADRFRADRAAGLIPGYADGGGPGAGRNRGGGTGDTANAARGLRDALRDAERALRQETAQRDKLRDRLRDQIDRRNEYLSGVRQNFTTDPFANVAGNVWGAGGGGVIGSLRNDIRGRQEFNRLTALIRKNGVRGGALTEIDSLDEARAVAGMTRADQRLYQRLYNQRAQTGVGGANAAAAFGAGIDRMRGDLQESVAVQKRLEREVKRLQGQLKNKEKKDHKSRQDAADRGRRNQDRAATDARRRAQRSGPR